MTNPIVMIYGCNCHEGQLYFLDKDKRITKVILGSLPVGYSMGETGMEFSYKDLDNIDDLITYCVFNLT